MKKSGIHTIPHFASDPWFSPADLYEDYELYKNRKLKVSIVIPTLDEEPGIADIIKYCRPYGDELLVVDGHSNDRTREIAKELGCRVVLDHGKGKGDAIRVAIGVVTGDIIVFIDADYSHRPADIPHVVGPILREEADHVVASRSRGGSDERHGDLDQLFRALGSDIITLGINFRFKVKLTESQNGFRAIRTDVARLPDELPL